MPMKRRGRAPADRSNRTLDPEQHERNSETNGEHRRDGRQRRRAPGGEELWTVRHHLEDRLSDGDRGEPEQGRASFERHLVALPVTGDDRKAREIAPAIATTIATDLRRIDRDHTGSCGAAPRRPGEKSPAATSQNAGCDNSTL